MKLWVTPRPKKMRFHDLRHSDVRLTADTCGHLVVEDLRNAVNAIAPDTRVVAGDPAADSASNPVSAA
jgi:hypothetical protein